MLATFYNLSWWTPKLRILPTWGPWIRRPSEDGAFTQRMNQRSQVPWTKDKPKLCPLAGQDVGSLHQPKFSSSLTSTAKGRMCSWRLTQQPAWHFFEILNLIIKIHPLCSKFTSVFKKKSQFHFEHLSKELGVTGRGSRFTLQFFYAQRWCPSLQRSRTREVCSLNTSEQSALTSSH